MQVKITAAALDDLAAAPGGMKLRIMDVLKRLESWPGVSGAKPLRGQLKGSWRIRTGGWRVLFAAEGDSITVFRIDNRKDVYER